MLTQLTFASLNSESSTYVVEDTQILQKSYLRRISLENIPQS